MKAKTAYNEMYSVQKLKYVNVVKHYCARFVEACMVVCSFIFTITTLIKWHDYAQTKAIHEAVLFNE